MIVHDVAASGGGQTRRHEGTKRRSVDLERRRGGVASAAGSRRQVTDRATFIPVASSAALGYSTTAARLPPCTLTIVTEFLCWRFRLRALTALCMDTRATEHSAPNGTTSLQRSFAFVPCHSLTGRKQANVTPLLLLVSAATTPVQETFH